MIHDELVTYEVAKLAKEKGFNVPTRTIKVEKIEGTEKEVWDEEECRYITQWETRSLRIPTQSLLQRWLRKEKGVCIAIYPNLRVNHSFEWIGYKKDEKCWTPVVSNMKEYNTYELALEDALKYALENLI